MMFYDGCERHLLVITSIQLFSKHFEFCLLGNCSHQLLSVKFELLFVAYFYRLNQCDFFYWSAFTLPLSSARLLHYIEAMHWDTRVTHPNNRETYKLLDAVFSIYLSL